MRRRGEEFGFSRPFFSLDATWVDPVVALGAGVEAEETEGTGAPEMEVVPPVLTGGVIVICFL
jgi:hypothetical protein